MEEKTTFMIINRNNLEAKRSRNGKHIRVSIYIENHTREDTQTSIEKPSKYYQGTHKGPQC